MQRRNSTKALAVAFTAAPLSTVNAAAEPYPTRPIRLIAPQTADVSMDVLVRIVAPRWSKLLG